MGKYQDTFERARRHPEAFWAEAAADIHWFTPYRKVLDASRAPFYRWFEGGTLNTCYNAIDHHVANGRADQAAVIYDSPVTATRGVFTYRQLLDQVARFAGVLASLGVSRGDRVIIYMPMLPETLIAMYACARIGAIHSVVFGGFGARELAARIEDGKPKAVLSASNGIEGTRIVPYKPLLDEAIRRSNHKPDHCVVLQRPQHRCALELGRDHDWEELLAGARPVDCVPVAATDPLYVLYTSGTTGQPKGIVRDNGGHAVALKWSMAHVYDARPGEVFWAASDFGWVVGHSYIAYAPLLAGCTTVIHEGKPVGTPDPGNFWRVISEHRVSVMFTAPTAFRAIKREDPEGRHFRKHDVSCLRALFLAGERLDPDTYHWAAQLLDRPVVDHWWQTETGWPVVSNCMGIERLPFKPGSPTRPVPGFEVAILDEAGDPLPANHEGAVAIRTPLPPGALSTLWNDDERFRSVYLSRYPGYYLTGDGGYVDEDGYVFIMGRIDDIIIVAGHNLSTGSIEESLASHPDVAECAVFGVQDALKTQLPVAMVVLKAGVEREPSIIVAELVHLVREMVGPVANLRHVGIVARLPKTRSGKVLRSTMRKIADGVPFEIPPTIEDPATIDEARAALRKLGYARESPSVIGG
ncbi:MAG: propionyl-CoA synthetase [Gammaproteobacteria bacterium]|nr:propionyl-CoA synthetase [Gammaproteobacteria bacterium]